MRGTNHTPGLAQYTGYLLRRVYAKSADCAQACIGEDTQIREIAILSILHEQGPLSQRQLGDVLHINRTIMVKLVDSIEGKGWLLRERNPADRRSYALKLTETGTKALEALQDDVDEGEAALTEALTAAERRQLKAQLRRLLQGDASVDNESLSDRANYLIAQAHRQLRGWAVEGLRPLGVDARGFGVLATLRREEPCSQNQVAVLLGVSAPAVLGFVDELEEAGLVQRSRKSADRRVYDLTLTDAGRTCLQAAEDAASQIQAEVVARLGEQGDRQLRRVLLKLLAEDSPE